MSIFNPFQDFKHSYDLRIKASLHNASGEKWVFFKRLDACSYARAADLMSTQSATGFEWSVRLIGSYSFYVGSASKVEQNNFIYQTDQKAILYYSNKGSPAIAIGSNQIHTNLPQQKSGDVIRFKFQPETKKLVIELVRI